LATGDETDTTHQAIGVHRTAGPVGLHDGRGDPRDLRQAFTANLKPGNVVDANTRRVPDFGQRQQRPHTGSCRSDLPPAHLGRLGGRLRARERRLVLIQHGVPHLFPDASELGRGALDAMFAPADVRPMCARK